MLREESDEVKRRSGEDEDMYRLKKEAGRWGGGESVLVGGQSGMDLQT